MWVVVAACGAAPARPQAVSGAALVTALQHGGYVIVMRHAHAPETPPGAVAADRANPDKERQLDGQGRNSARVMGAALRALRVPIGTVWSSPTYRARQTATIAGLPSPKIAQELGDNGHSMQATNNNQAAWLRRHVIEAPQRGTDTVIVTQYPNISAAFDATAAGMKDGEALVFRPGKGAPQAVGGIGIDQWPVLAEQLKRERQHGT